MRYFKQKRNTTHRVVQLLRSLRYTPIIDVVYLHYLRGLYADYADRNYNSSREKDYRVKAFVIPLRNGYRHVVIGYDIYLLGREKIFVFDTTERKTCAPRFLTECRVDCFWSMQAVREIVNPAIRGKSLIKIPFYNSEAFNHRKYLKSVFFPKRLK